MASTKTLNGNAGEHYVVAELMRRGIIAGLMPRNTPGFDILATNGEYSVKLRVKTKSTISTGWQFAAKNDGTIFLYLKRKDDFTILVDLGSSVQNLRFYVVPTWILNSWISADRKMWMNTPAKRKAKHDPNSKHRLLNWKSRQKDLENYLDWDILWE